MGLITGSAYQELTYALISVILLCAFIFQVMVRPPHRHRGNAIVLLIVLVAFAYLMFVQTLAAYEQTQQAAAGFRSLLAERSIKCLLLVSSLSLFLYFFSLQEYQLTFDKLLKSFLDIDAASTHSPGHPLDNLHVIEDSVDRLIKDRINYAHQLGSQADELRDNFLIRLLKGWVPNQDQASELCKSHGLDLMDSACQVMIFDQDKPPENQPANKVLQGFEVLKRQLQQQLLPQHRCHAVQIKELMVCLVVSHDKGVNIDPHKTSGPPTKLQELQALMAATGDELGIVFHASLGGVQSGIKGAALSYKQATQVLQRRSLIGDDAPISLYQPQEEPLSGQQEVSMYQWETRFMNFIDAGNLANAQRVFLEMLDSSYLRLAPESDQLKHRLLSLSDCMVTALSHLQFSFKTPLLNFKDFKQQVISQQSLPQLRTTIQKIFLELNAQAQSSKQGSYYGKMMDVSTFVRDHYADNSLSVSAIARSFNLSPAYLSRTFKRVFGVGLASYIEYIRIREAKELLLNTTASVHEIAERVGFNSVLTLNRTFRRQEGTTAGRLRKSLKD